MNARTIARRIIYRVQLNSLIFKPKKPSTFIQRNILGIIGINSKTIQTKRGAWYKWETPNPGWYKLNIDGSARLGICTGGGIIRESNGNMVIAFSNFYGLGSNNYAEFAALRDGLNLCHALGINQVMIESDSMLVVTAIRSRRVMSWRLEYVFRQCMVALWSTPLVIDHIFRQRNMVADRLAAWAHEHKSSREVATMRNLPKQIRSYIITDKHGLPQLRC